MKNRNYSKILNFIGLIFFQKIGFLKFVVKYFKTEINIRIDVIYSQYGIVMRYVLLC